MYGIHQLKITINSNLPTKNNSSNTDAKNSMLRLPGQNQYFPRQHFNSILIEYLIAEKVLF